MSNYWELPSGSSGSPKPSKPVDPFPPGPTHTATFGGMPLFPVAPVKTGRFGLVKSPLAAPVHAVTSKQKPDVTDAHALGVAHGKALALKQHGTASATNAPRAAAASSTAAAPSAASGKGTSAAQTAAASAKPITLNDLLKQARALAAADTQAQIQAIQNAQAQDRAAAAQRATDIIQAATAAAALQGGIGDQTQAGYEQAAKDIAGFAQGFSGQLGDTATSAANDVLAKLKAVGAANLSPEAAAQAGTLPNVVYGLGGNLPASALLTGGTAQAAAQRQLPASTLGYGQQQAAGALGQGETQAQGLVQQILDAQAGKPKLAQSYLQNLQNQLLALQNAQTNQALANSLIGSRSDQTAIAQQNADTAAYRAKVAAATAAANVASKAQSAKVKAKTHGLTPQAYQRYAAKALGAARNYHRTWTDSKGNTNPPLTWQQFMTAAQAQGIPTWVIIEQGRKIYTPAEIKQGLVPGQT